VTKVVFLQSMAEEWLGPMCLSSLLKARGHACEIYVEALEEGDFIKKALESSPDVVAFSCLASDFPWAVRMASEIKRQRPVLVILGGTHVTLNPDESLAPPAIDVVCIGEGEYPMAELADALSRGQDFSGIGNLWLKKNGRVVKNEIRNLVEDLDSLPFPDRKLYAKYPFFAGRGKRPVHLGRGCPYDCSFCHNSSKKRIFEGKGRYVRWRSQENILAEIQEIEQQEYVKVIHFIDDSFGTNKDWLEELLGKLAERTKTRHIIQASMRADMVSEDLCRAFSDYGTSNLRLRIAVETGNEEFRKSVLGKDLSNQALIRAAGLFKKYKIHFMTYSILGLPGETFPMAIETLKMNMKLRPSMAICFIFQPYPGTVLTTFALEKGYLSPERLSKLGSPEFSGQYHSRSVLTQKDIHKAENLQKVFGLVVRYPFLFYFFRVIVPYRVFSRPLFLLYRLHLRFLLSRRLQQDCY